MPLRQIAQPIKELRRRRHQAHVADDRLQDHAGNALPVSGKRIGQPLRIVEAQEQRVLRAAGRHTRRIGHAERGGTGAGRDEQRIDMTVIAAGEFDNHIAPGEAARQANGAHRRLGTARHHAHHFDRRHRIDDQFSELGFQLGRSAEAGPVVQRFLNGADDARMTVAQDQRSPRADVIQVVIAVEIEEARPFAASDENRIAADGAEGAGRTVDAAGNEMAGTLKRLSTADARGFHGSPFMYDI